jgi:glyoxylase-like metal-dependent hydrolase (beta-lactamase superfamily II)
MSEQAWDEPGVFEVLHGVFRIPLPLPNDGLRAVNVYAIVDGDGLVLIDAGWALKESLEQLERTLADIDHKVADIRQFLVTHAHRDHYTQAVTIRRLFGAKVAIGAGERPTLEILADPNHDPGGPMQGWLIAAGAEAILEQVRTWRAARTSTFASDSWELPDSWLAPGTITLHSRELDVIETPGHTAGHVVFHDRAASALFAGDHVLSQITPSIGLEPGPNGLPLAAYMASLTLMLSLPDAQLLPAHGPITASVHTRVNELLTHHERRLTQSAAAVEQGASTSFEVARILKWTRRERTFEELGDLFNQTLAIGETRAHLEVGVARGWLTASTDSGGVVRYQRA